LQLSDLPKWSDENHQSPRSGSPIRPHADTPTPVLFGCGSAAQASL
jgi:hypothetical protein